MQPEEALLHHAMMLAEYRERVLGTDHELSHAKHDLDALATENLYLRRVIAHLMDIETPKAGEVVPYEGPFSMETLGMKEPHEGEHPEEPDDNGMHTGISGPAIYE